MASLTNVNSGDAANSSCVQQIIDVMKGTVGAGNIPVSFTGINDAANYALDVENLDPTNQRAFRVRDSSGETKLSVDGSPAVVTLNQATISSGTLASPTITGQVTMTGSSVAGVTLTSPVINTAVSGSAGFGAWSSFTPTLSQNSSNVPITIQRAAYNVVGKTAMAEIMVTVTSTAASVGVIRMGGLPAAISPVFTSTAVPRGHYSYNSSALNQFQQGLAFFDTSTSLFFLTPVAPASSVAAIAYQFLGLTPSFGANPPDKFAVQLTGYETA